MKEMIEELRWAAWHLFSPDFCDRYEKKQLSLMEWLNLVQSDLVDTKQRLAKLRWYQFKLRRIFNRIITNLTALKEFLLYNT